HYALLVLIYLSFDNLMRSTPFFFFTPPPTAEISTLSLHDALPIYVRPRLPDLSRVGRTDHFARRATRGRCGATRSVAGVTGRCDLHAHVAEALLHRSPGIFFHLGKTAAARVKITVRAVTHLAAEQLIERHAGAFGFDVPEGDVDAAHRIEQHRPIAPIRAHITRLPDILDFVYIAPDQKGLQILLDRRLNDKRTLCKGRAPPTHEAGLRRFDFH